MRHKTRSQRLLEENQAFDAKAVDLIPALTEIKFSADATNHQRESACQLILQWLLRASRPDQVMSIVNLLDANRENLSFLYERRRGLPYYDPITHKRRRLNFGRHQWQSFVATTIEDASKTWSDIMLSAKMRIVDIVHYYGGAPCGNPINEQCARFLQLSMTGWHNDDPNYPDDRIVALHNMKPNVFDRLPAEIVMRIMLYLQLKNEPRANSDLLAFAMTSRQHYKIARSNGLAGWNTYYLPIYGFNTENCYVYNSADQPVAIDWQRLAHHFNTHSSAQYLQQAVGTSLQHALSLVNSHSSSNMPTDCVIVKIMLPNALFSKTKRHGVLLPNSRLNISYKQIESAVMFFEAGTGLPHFVVSYLQQVPVQRFGSFNWTGCHMTNTEFRENWRPQHLTKSRLSTIRQINATLDDMQRCYNPSTFFSQVDDSQHKVNIYNMLLAWRSMLVTYPDNSEQEIFAHALNTYAELDDRHVVYPSVVINHAKILQVPLSKRDQIRDTLESIDTRAASPENPNLVPL